MESNDELKKIDVKNRKLFYGEAGLNKAAMVG